MAISFISQQSADSNTLTMPTHTTGDLIVGFAGREGSATPPTIPGGWTTLQTGGTVDESSSIAYKIAASGSETFGTWTNATGVLVHVYRGARGCGAVSAVNNGATSIDYPALTLNQTDGNCWVMLCAIHGWGTASTLNAPSTYVNRSNNTGASAAVGGHDSDGGETTYAGSNGTLTGGGFDNYRAHAIEILPTVTCALTGTCTASINEDDITAGGETAILTLTDGVWAASSVTSDIGFVSNALGGTTTTTSFSITLPTTSANDIIILEFSHRGTGDGTIGGTYSGPAFTLKHSQTFGAGSAFSGKTYYSRASGNHSGQTVTGSGLTDACAAIVTIYSGAAQSGDPLSDATVVGEENASGNETQAQITTATDKAWVVLVVVNSPDLAVATQACTSPGALTERAERLSTGGTDASIAHASAAKATAGATGSFTWTQTNAASGSWAYAIKPHVTTPFADARTAIRDGFDSDQAEGTGWDAQRSTILPVGNVVRTSDTVATLTFAIAGSYNITAQEVVTATVPIAALAGGGGSPITASPTFTIATSGGGGGAVIKDMMFGYIIFPR